MFWHPSGVREVGLPVTGGIVAALLDPRLISGSPPGCAVHDHSVRLSSSESANRSVPPRGVAVCFSASVQRLLRLNGRQSRAARREQMSKIKGHRNAMEGKHLYFALRLPWILTKTRPVNAKVV